MATEKEYLKLKPLDSEQLWTAWPVATERAARQDEDGVVRELTALPGYALDPEHGQRFNHGEAMRWLFRAVASSHDFEADTRYKGRIQQARQLERDLKEQGDLKLAQETGTLWDHIHRARARRYTVNVRELGKLISSRQFYVGFESGHMQAESKTFHLAKLEGVAAVQQTLGNRGAEVVISGKDGVRGRKPEGLRTQRFIYEELPPLVE